MLPTGLRPVGDALAALARWKGTFTSPFSSASPKAKRSRPRRPEKCRYF